MNDKVFVAILNWIKAEDGGRKNPIPMNYSMYCPQISVEGENVVNGSAWSIFCLNFEMVELNKTKSYIKYLNQNDAPDNLRIGTKIEIYEMGKPVASGEIIADSNMKF